MREEACPLLWNITPRGRRRLKVSPARRVGVGVLIFTLRGEKSSNTRVYLRRNMTEQTEHPLPEPFSEVCVYGTQTEQDGTS